MDKQQASHDAQKVLRLLAKKLKLLGFERTKPTFFTRTGRYVVEFVHVHKFTFGPMFRVHFGVRVRSDAFTAAHLNGPCSDEMADPAVPDRRRYELTFAPDEASWELCAAAILQCVSTEGVAWFASLENERALLAPGAPLPPAARAALQRELEDPSCALVSEATQGVLNVA